MANIVLSSNNRIASGAATLYGNGDASFPLTNLLDPVFSKVWRHTPGSNADGNTAKFQFTLSEVANASHVVLCRHNLGESSQVRVRAGTARLDLDFTDDDLTSPYITFGGGTNGTRTNEYGVMVAGTCPRYEHDRRYYENGFKYSEDLSQPDWVEVSGAKKYSCGKTVDFAQAGSRIRQSGLELYNDTYEVRAQVRTVSGDTSFALELNNGTADVTGATQTATADWQWFTASLATAAVTSAGSACVRKINAAGVLQIRRLQIRRGSSGGRYRKTTSQRRYQRIGVITEAGATNSILRSQELDNAAWTKSVASVTPNTVVSPDGTTTMDRVTLTSINGFISQDATLGGTTARALSVYFRASASTETSADLYILWFSGGATQWVVLNFNPSTGAVGSSSGVGATLRSAGVKDCGGGFYRAYVMGVGTDALNTTVRCRLNLNGAAGAYATFWGFQHESTYVTTYIPTTTAAVTRTVDTAVVEAATWFPYVWNATEGTIYHEAMMDDVDSKQAMVGSSIEIFSAGTNVIRSRVYDNTTTVGLQVAGYVGGVLNVNVNGSGARAVAHRIAVRYRASDWAVGMNGTVTAGSSIIPAMTSIDLMNSPAVTAYLRRFAIWPIGKSTTDIQSLSTSGPSAIEYDGGWKDALQMTMRGSVPALWGYDYDVIKPFNSRAVEWVRVQVYDPAKTSSSTPFEIGRVFMGRLTMKPANNAEYGLGNGWIERSTATEAEDGRLFFTDRFRVREVTFSIPYLSHAEGATIHEMQGTGGIAEETLFLPDPDDEAECQRYGFVGRLSQLDPLRYPMIDVRSANFTMTKKR